MKWVIKLFTTITTIVVAYKNAAIVCKKWITMCQENKIIIIGFTVPAQAIKQDLVVATKGQTQQA